mmetsp:Transcript_5434/g.9584  ORF Transcript_5434/g.9584 Transcript_5434/m.9584 type:complete len:259 (-) Transcript_5434:1005-1781(-)
MPAHIRQFPVVCCRFTQQQHALIVIAAIHRIFESKRFQTLHASCFRRQSVLKACIVPPNPSILHFSWILGHILHVHQQRVRRLHKLIVTRAPSLQHNQRLHHSTLQTFSGCSNTRRRRRTPLHARAVTGHRRPQFLRIRSSNSFYYRIILINVERGIRSDCCSACQLSVCWIQFSVDVDQRHVGEFCGKLLVKWFNRSTRPTPRRRVVHNNCAIRTLALLDTAQNQVQFCRSIAQMAHASRWNTRRFSLGLGILLLRL